MIDTDAPQETWESKGLCNQTDPEAFFPEKGGSTKEAKRICLGCEVRAECLEYALDNDQRFGVWGGLSERERRAVKHGNLLPLEQLHTPPRCCPICGHPLTGKSKYNAQFCSNTCRAKHDTGKPRKDVARECHTCGTAFNGHSRAKYCSDGCRRQGRIGIEPQLGRPSKQHVKRCHVCDNEFAGHHKTIYCSDACRLKGHNTNRRRKRAAA